MHSFTQIVTKKPNKKTFRLLQKLQKSVHSIIAYDVISQKPKGLSDEFPCPAENNLTMHSFTQIVIKKKKSIYYKNCEREFVL